MSTTITTWQAVAKVLGLSYDTVLRRRKARGDKTSLPFRDSDEVWTWWRTPEKPPEPPRPRARRPTPGRLDAPLDPVALARSLTQRG